MTTTTAATTDGREPFTALADALAVDGTARLPLGRDEAVFTVRRTADDTSVLDSVLTVRTPGASMTVRIEFTPVLPPDRGWAAEVGECLAELILAAGEVAFALGGTAGDMHSLLPAGFITAVRDRLERHDVDTLDQDDAVDGSGLRHDG